MYILLLVIQSNHSIGAWLIKGSSPRFVGEFLQRFDLLVPTGEQEMSWFKMAP